MAGDESAFSYAREAIDLVGVLSARSIELGGQLGHGGCDVAGVIRPAKKKQQVKYKYCRGDRGGTTRDKEDGALPHPAPSPIHNCRALYRPVS